MNYVLHLLIYFNIFAILALSLNLVVGYCGLLTLAHASYYAVGAYTYALLSQVAGLSFVPAAVGSMVVPAVLSLAVSLPAWRFKGDFFVVISLAVQALFFSLLNNWFDGGSPAGSLRNLTNGPFGIAGIPRPSILGYQFESTGAVTALSLGLLIASAFVFWRLKESPWGRLLKAMRDDELASRGLGKNTRVAKVQAFAIACAFAGLAGVIYASYVGYIDPSNGSLDESILMLSALLVGGAGNFRGPLVGAVVLLLIPEILRFAAIPDSVAANLRLLIYGLLLAVMIHIRPQGLSGVYRIR